MTMQMVGTGEAHPFIIPLTKIDVERRMVIGTAAEEIEDKAHEIMDYATARPQFESWSNGYKEATGGLSKGNLRVMHTKQVAGRLDDISFDDASKKVMICAKISDSNEWQKVLDGAYTGFSIGGGYLKKWNDPDTGLTRYTPIVREISLVDQPCMPTARFAELVKGDGMSEQLELRGVARTFGDLWKAQATPPTFAELAKAGSLIPFSLKQPNTPPPMPPVVVGLSTKGKILAAGVTAAAATGIAALRMRGTYHPDDQGQTIAPPVQHDAGLAAHVRAAAIGGIGAAGVAVGAAKFRNGVDNTVRMILHNRHLVPPPNGKRIAMIAAPIGAAFGLASSYRNHVENQGEKPDLPLRVASGPGDLLRNKGRSVIGEKAGEMVGQGVAMHLGGSPHDAQQAGQLGNWVGGYVAGKVGAAEKRVRKAQRGFRRDVIALGQAHAKGELTDAQHEQRVKAAKARWADHAKTGKPVA